MSKSRENRNHVSLAKFRKAMRRAVADYMKSEGCSCCRDSDAHREHMHRLGKLLKVPVYKNWHGNNEDGYDFSPYRSKS